MCPRMAQQFAGRLTLSIFNRPPVFACLPCCHNEQGRWPVPRVLIIEDERKVLRGLERGLQAERYEVVTAATGEAGRVPAIAPPFDRTILHLMLPRPDGLRVLAAL